MLLLVISSCFVALGIFLTSKDDLQIGWLCVLFFGLGVLVALINLLPGCSYLDLTSDGMEIRSLYRKWFVRWTDVQEFFPASVANRPMICWNYTQSFAGQRLGRKISSGLTGVEAALPDTYGMYAEDLANLLNDWRTKHAVAP